jgi:6-pyruvoyltetrahydropterin/6-carboxytetrahydropterin synthase
MAENHWITREIEIDAAHRIPDHGSKCRNLHGHRYKIAATCIGPLFEQGEQTGMVLDFGFLKQEMLKEIDAYCDHGMLVWVEDPWLDAFLQHAGPDSPDSDVSLSKRALLARMNGDHQILLEGRFGKTLVLSTVPTSENLARHWFNRLSPRVTERGGGRVALHRVDVWETPNCVATYCAPTA